MPQIHALPSFHLRLLFILNVIALFTSTLRLRRAVAESPEIISPPLHVACTLQPVERWVLDDWYVSGGHALHVRCAVAVSADMSWPGPHVGCVTHSVSRCCVASWYSSVPHGPHTPAFVVLYAEIFCPAPQYGCATQAPPDR